ncbi:hypothetical protein [Foetidibacter luteolus]|uniref:hypothetical protein n=1 Tax=Foetidibacter luteolus TaxID=2608880 RepID=UPI00129B3273|nr:hypothetical protein [Foetidibacter luteolus]
MEDLLVPKYSEKELTGLNLLESHQYWQTKRILFNLLVGINGVIAISLHWNKVTFFDFFGIILWGIVANIFFSTGYALESFVIVTSNNDKNLKSVREFLFWAGCLSYIFVGYVTTGSYYSLDTF